MHSAHIASPIQIKQELGSVEAMLFPDNNTFHKNFDLDCQSDCASHIGLGNRDSIKELSLIQAKEDSMFRHFSNKQRNPTDNIKREEDHGFNFDFFNQIIMEAMDELESVKNSEKY